MVLAGEKGIVNTGCTASIEKVVKAYPDGRMDLITVGRRRFEIILLNDEKSYLRGAVEFFDDEAIRADPARGAQTRDGSLQRYSFAPQPGTAQDPELTDPQLSFQLAQVVPDVDFRQVLLAIRSEADRMRRLAEFFPTYSARQRHIQHVRAVAPTNGHAKKPAGL